MRYLVGLLVFVFALPVVSAQSPEPFLPVTTADLQVKDVPGDPGAKAIQLYWSYFKDDNLAATSVYRRIKVLKEGGRQYADVEVPLGPVDSLKELRARTIRPDGSIVEFAGKPFEKTVVKARGQKFRAITFTLPEANVGSIVEYSYVVTLPRHRVDLMSRWQLQGDLYTVQEKFRFMPFQGFVNIPSEWGHATRKSQVMCSYQNQVGAPTPTHRSDGLMQLELTNVSAFDGEDFMPAESDFRPSITCYYGGREFASADQFWPEWQKRISLGTEEFLGNASSFKEVAAQTIGNESDPEKKVRLLYARAQQIRNLSYERDRSTKEEKKEKIKPSHDAKEVLQHGYGTNWEIDAVFVDLARAAGFDASMVATGDRHDLSFSRLILWLGQLNGIAALVKVNGKDLVLDPGTKFCPFGTLFWHHTAATALNFARGGDFLTTPGPQLTPLRRVVKLKVMADGSATGEVLVQMDGQDALVHRLDAIETDEAGRRKSFEEEVQGWLPAGFTAKMADSQGWDSAEGPLTARFQIESPSAATSAGKRLLVPSYLLSTPFKKMFSQSTRRFPIEFFYPFSENDEIKIEIPAGYELEAAASRRKAGLSYADYEVVTNVEGKELTTKRSLRFEGLNFTADKFPELKNFFTIVQAGDSGQIVLAAAAAAAAQQSK